MSDLIHINLVKDGETKELDEPLGTTLGELAEKYLPCGEDFKPVFARVGDVGHDLLYTLKRSCEVEFLDLDVRMARLTYQRTVYFLFLIVLHELMPQARASVKYPLNDGIYIEIKNGPDELNPFAWKVEKRMRDLTQENIIFSRKVLHRDAILSDNPPESLTAEQIEFIRGNEVQEVIEYSYNGFSKIFYDPLARSSGMLDIFEIVPYKGNIIIRLPQCESPYAIPEYRDDYKLFDAFREISRWRDFVNVRYISDLNRKVENGEWHDLILINEAYQEKKIAEIADRIVAQNKRIILIAGPSSSGKTTFAQRLCIQLRVNGKRPLYMGTDDYFLEKSQHVADENGKIDFESIEAVDINLFNEQMNALLAGETVDMPVFDFVTGSKRYGMRITRADADQPIVIEGIHALNARLTEQIADEEKFKIYISPLTALNIDENNRIPVTDIRLIRRMARDMRSRNKSPRETIDQWTDVRAGEIRNIFPFSGEADALFNAATMYELAVLKPIVEPGLREIKHGEPQYLEAQRVLRILRCVKPLYKTDDIGNNAIMREFVGGGIWVK